MSSSLCYAGYRCARRLPIRTGTNTPALLKARQSFSPVPQIRTSVAEPFRKQLKDEARKNRELNRHSRQAGATTQTDSGEWDLTVGIEIHAQLNTTHKLFSDAQTSLNAESNSHVAAFDAALPGSMPIFQPATLIPALNAALALNCDIQLKSSFDRKHYFYHDQPAGYQITQYYHPFAKDGYIDLFDHDGIAPEDGKHKRVRIKQIQMEQDTAKTTTDPDYHLINMNRVGHPLIEIITHPDIHHSATAAAFVRKVQAILVYVHSCVIGMEMGGLRADVNVSVLEKSRAVAQEPDSLDFSKLGQRTEIKNLSSFSAIQDAVEAEKRRQIAVLGTGGVIEGETRGWTIGSTETTRLRGKEGEVDYRYMPDPDIAPVYLSSCLVDALKSALPKTPDQWLEILTTESRYKLTQADAKTLIGLDQGARLDFYLEVVSVLESAKCGSPKSGRVACNWVLQDLGGLLKNLGASWEENRVTSNALGTILIELHRKTINGIAGRQALKVLASEDEDDVHKILDKENLWTPQVSPAEYDALAKSVIDQNPDIVKKIDPSGKPDGKLQFLVGQMMRAASNGQLDPSKMRDALRTALEAKS